jgi:hypothetical protein
LTEAEKTHRLILQVAVHSIQPNGILVLYRIVDIVAPVYANGIRLEVIGGGGGARRCKARRGSRRCGDEMLIVRVI